MTRRTLPGARALVTGASSGIGRELALELARSGARVLVTARREEKLVALVQDIESQGGEAYYLAGDVTDAQHRELLLTTVREKLGGLDLLVNNAGVGAAGLFINSTAERMRQIFEINYFSVVELIRGALPLLQAGKSPMIVNVSSVLGHRAVPNKSEYCASKFALHGFSDALRAELAPLGIDVLLVSPSTTASEFWEHRLGENASARPPRRAMSSQTVARIAVRAIRAGKHEVILSLGGKLLVWFDRLSPPLCDWLIAKFA